MLICLLWIDSAVGFAFTILVQDNTHHISLPITFTVYGVPEQLSSDGGPQLNSSAFKEFLSRWGVKHRLSSVEYPQSNGRTELGIKAANHIIYDNTPPNGSLEKVAKAIMQYRNTPLPDLNLSPAQIFFHHNIRDYIPTHPSLYELHKEWVISA